MIKDITIGQYFPGNSPVHRLDPRMKLILSIVYIVTVFACKTLPSFAAAAVNALGFAWKSGVAAEVICRPVNSIGRLLQDAKLYLETPRVFALTAVVGGVFTLFFIFYKKFFFYKFLTSAGRRREGGGWGVV